jgi:hypothetical protein
MKQLTKDTMDSPHFKSIRAWALIWHGQPAGNLRAVYGGRTSAGGLTCLVSIRAFTGPLSDACDTVMRGKCLGLNFNVFDGAVSDAFRRAGIAKRDKGCSGEARAELEAWGYTVIEVC